jgi:hypothetical protein
MTKSNVSNSYKSLLQEMAEYRAQLGEGASSFACQAWGTWAEDNSPSKMLTPPLEEETEEDEDGCNSENDDDVTTPCGAYMSLFLDSAQITEMKQLLKDSHDITAVLSKK